MSPNFSKISCDYCQLPIDSSHDLYVFSTIGRKRLLGEIYRFHHECFENATGVTFTTFKKKYGRKRDNNKDLSSVSLNEKKWNEFSGL